MYSHAELQRLLNATDIVSSGCSRLQAMTYRTLLLVLYGAGLRISEAIGLTVADIDLAERVLTVRNTKFYKTSLVPIGAQLAAALTAYSVQRSTLLLPKGQDSAFLCSRSGCRLTYQHVVTLFQRIRSGAGIVCPQGVTVATLRPFIVAKGADDQVFCGRTGEPLTRFGVHRIVVACATAAAQRVESMQTKRISPHTMRHTTAVHLLRAGVDINTIRAWLGHVSLDTTHIYAEVDLDMKAKALASVDITDLPTGARVNPSSNTTTIMSFMKQL